VADKSYAVGGRISYESQLVHAVVERRAPMDGRLRPAWEGSIEDGTRKCIITGKLIGEDAPFIWESPMIKDIKTKNSPEWGANPDKQLFYHASRDWARIYVPDVLLGVYTRDEIESSEFGPNRARDVSDLASRLPAQGDGGYDAQGIAQTLRTARGEPEPEAGTNEPAKEDGTSEAPKSSKAKTRKEPANEHFNPQTGEVIENPTQDEYLKGIQERAAAREMVPDVPVVPTNKEEYASYASAWIIASDSQRAAEERWAGEREMRAQLKVSVTERKKLEKLLNERFA